MVQKKEIWSLKALIKSSAALTSETFQIQFGTFVHTSFSHLITLFSISKRKPYIVFFKKRYYLYSKPPPSRPSPHQKKNTTTTTEVITMKFLEIDSLEQLNTVFRWETPECILNGRVEAYSCECPFFIHFLFFFYSFIQKKKKKR